MLDTERPYAVDSHWLPREVAVLVSQHAGPGDEVLICCYLEKSMQQHAVNRKYFQAIQEWLDGPKLGIIAFALSCVPSAIQTIEYVLRSTVEAGPCPRRPSSAD